MNTLECVKEFHEAFGHPVKSEPDLSDLKTNELRYELLREEVEELKEGLDEKDIVKVGDALSDIEVVLQGAYLALGFYRYKDAMFSNVHESNMSKLGEDGKPIYREDGKILKGPNYKAPDIKSILEQGLLF